MKRSQLFTKTLRDAPADEIAKNARLLIRAGFIAKEMAGVYAFLPLGLKVLEKIKNIICEEMNAIGAQEVAMTALLPREIFEKTERWDDKIVDNWFKTRLNNGTELGLGLTHEEPIVNMMRDFVNSYKDLPVAVYQVQTKFRNEKRAQAGLLRGREFLMKDAYSFSRTEAEHAEIYEKFAKTYAKIYEKLGIGNLVFRTKADGGYFTDKFSDEFQMLSEIGEDTIFVDFAKNLAVNKEILTEENLAKLDLKRENLVEKKAIEVGNIFPLESKYSDALDLKFSDENGSRKSIIMGCYGIGVSRIMGAIAENFADEKGLVWPENVAPFQICLINLGENLEVLNSAQKIYDEFRAKNVEILWDDRISARAGEKFADADLFGIPHRIVISAKSLANGGFEIKARNSEKSEILSAEKILAKFAK